MKKLSRGQLSAVGVIVGLASRAPLTFFDEPYLGLDAVARQIFYDRLLADYAEHPRTVVLSTHLIDEVGDLLEHVLVIDEGRILIDRDADELRGSATTVVGSRAAVDAFVAGRDVLHRDGVGGLASVTVAGLDDADRRAATAAGLELAPVSLQQLVVRSTTRQPRISRGGTDDHPDHRVRASDLDPGRPHPSASRRLNVANPWTALILPWIILIGILLLNIGIWALVTRAAGPA